MSSVLHQLDVDQRSALRARDARRTQIIRMLRSAIRYEEIDRRSDADDEMVRRVLTREARRREEAIAIYRDGDRPDKAADEAAELEVIRAYLPPQLDGGAIEAEAQRVIAEIGAGSTGDVGKVMGALVPRLRARGSVDGKQINAIVRRLLGGADA